MISPKRRVDTATTATYASSEEVRIKRQARRSTLALKKRDAR